MIKEIEKEIKDLRNPKLLKSKLYSFTEVKELVEGLDKDYNDRLNDFVKRIKSRCCCPNKPLNTFEYAREIEEVIDEELEEF